MTLRRESSVMIALPEEFDPVISVLGPLSACGGTATWSYRRTHPDQMPSAADTLPA